LHKTDKTVCKKCSSFVSVQVLTKVINASLSQQES